MNGKEKIGEIRGISKNQNLEADMEKILEEKLNDFEDKDKYLQKVKDMNMLTILEKKQKEDIKFTNEELRFLYEIESSIQGFGWGKDPRIEEIKSLRNSKKDIATIYGFDEKNIATEVNNINDETLVFYGDLIWNSNAVPTCFSNLQFIFGDVDFRKLTSALNLDSLKWMAGDCLFSDLPNSEGLKSLETIKGNLFFYSLVSANELGSLKYIGGNAYFHNLTDARGLLSLEYIGANAYFRNLNDARGLLSLEYIGGSAEFSSLFSANGLNSLKSIGGIAFFTTLTDARGLESLQYISGDAYFDNLITTDGLDSLQEIGGRIKTPYFALKQLLLRNNSNHHK